MIPESAAGSVRAAYNTVAASYARVLPDTSFESSLDLAMIQQFADALCAGTADGGILDAGCGTGRMIAHLESLGLSDIEGVDLSEAMIAQARNSHPHRHFKTGDLAALPYAGRSFRGVLAWYSVIHTPPEHLPDIVTELARVTRHGGHVLLGFQAGIGQRTMDRAYGHDVLLTAWLHDPADVANTPHPPRLHHRRPTDAGAAVSRGARASVHPREAFRLTHRIAVGVLVGPLGVLMCRRRRVGEVVPGHVGLSRRPHRGRRNRR